MRTTTSMASLLCLLGCGAQPEVAGTTKDSAEISSMAAQLRSDSTHGLIAAGDDEIDVPPSVFGTATDVVGRFLFVAVRDRGGGVRGLYRVSESLEGSTFHYSGRLTCAGIYDFNGLTGNRVKVGGVIDSTDDATVAVGSFIWWQAIDDRKLHRPDQSTFPGFGDEAANEAFCGSSTPPRFGPFDLVQGNIVVNPSGHDD
jgi:hypothetical protein